MIDPYTIIAAAALVLLLILLYGEKRESTTWKLASKPLLSALFIVTALLQLDSLPLAWWILGGLAFSWLGDVCLVFSQRKMFLFGLVAFLLGHVSYAVGFYMFGSLELRSLAGLAAMLVLAVVIFLWLRPHLGRMTGPVIAYILVISVMVGGAVAMFLAPQWAAAGRRAVLAGAMLFFTSDIFVARNKFVADSFINRLVGLPLYYSGQFLLALSIGLL